MVFQGLRQLIDYGYKKHYNIDAANSEDGAPAKAETVTGRGNETKSAGYY